MGFKVLKKKKKETKKETPIRKKGKRWNWSLLVDVYELARGGASDTKLCEILQIQRQTFISWKKKYPEISYALKKAKAVSSITFSEFVFDRLPPHLKDVWEEINACVKDPTALGRVQKMIEGRGKGAQQHLFLYALANSHFSVSEACKKVGVTRKRFESWVRDDIDFSDLVDEIHQAKKDFLETKLLERVGDGDVASTIFANKTMNRDRGYAEKVEHQVTGELNIQQTVVSIEDLSLPLEVRKIILEALRAASNNVSKINESNPPRLIEGEVLSRKVVKDDA